MTESLFGGGAILVGLLMFAATALKWPVWMSYLPTKNVHAGTSYYQSFMSIDSLRLC